jgi:hypothetical protein
MLRLTNHRFSREKGSTKDYFEFRVQRNPYLDTSILINHWAPAATQVIIFRPTGLLEHRGRALIQDFGRLLNILKQRSLNHIPDFFSQGMVRRMERERMTPSEN